MGEWLKGNVDWALSRDRYWGTPLPVWVCDQEPDHVEWIGSYEELAARAGPLGDDFDPHRPYIDKHTWSCGECGGTMRRTPEVVDDGRTGLLVPPARPELAAERVLSLARDAAARQRLAAQARQRLTGAFEIEEMVVELEHVYTTLLGSVAAPIPASVACYGP